MCVYILMKESYIVSSSHSSQFHDSSIYTHSKMAWDSQSSLMERGGLGGRGHEIVVLTEIWCLITECINLGTILSSLQQSNQAYVIPCLGNITEGPFQGMWRHPFSCIHSNKDILSCKHPCCCCWFEIWVGAAAAATTLSPAAVMGWSSARIHVTVRSTTPLGFG